MKSIKIKIGGYTSSLYNWWLTTKYIQKKRNTYIKNIQKQGIVDKNVSIISSNCMAGIIYHNLGMKFMSPTINMFISSKDFLKFVENIGFYLSHELIFEKTSIRDYPIAKLHDITINFNHYSSFSDAKSKWEERSKRIDWDAIVIMMHDRGLDDDDLDRFKKLPYKKVMFTNARNSIRESFFLSKYEKKSKVGNYLRKDISGFSEFEKQFNYVKWLKS